MKVNFNDTRTRVSVHSTFMFLLSYKIVLIEVHCSYQAAERHIAHSAAFLSPILLKKLVKIVLPAKKPQTRWH